jgi:hypothetical protein
VNKHGTTKNSRLKVGKMGNWELVRIVTFVRVFENLGLGRVFC